MGVRSLSLKYSVLHATEEHVESLMRKDRVYSETGRVWNRILTS